MKKARTNSFNKYYIVLRLSILVSLVGIIVIACTDKESAEIQPELVTFSKIFGGSLGDYAESIQQTADSGYVVAGYSNSVDGDVIGNRLGTDYWITKISSNGSLSWQKSLGGSYEDRAYSIEKTNDGGYVLAGYSRSSDGDVTENHGNYDYWITKLGVDGSLIWQKSLGGSNNDVAWSIQQTDDGGYFVAGESNSEDGDITGNHGGFDIWVTKLGIDGSLKWQKSLGGSKNEAASSFQQTDDGGYVVVGYSESEDGDVTGNQGKYDYWVIKLGFDGSLLWQKSFGGSNYDFANSIQLSHDGGYIVAGQTLSNDGDVTGNHGKDDYWITKISNSGSLTWQKSLGGSNNDVAYSIQPTEDGGYVVAGYSDSVDGDITIGNENFDYWIIKLSDLGLLTWQKKLGGYAMDNAKAIQQTNDGGFVIAGYSQSENGDVPGNHGNADFWIIKLDTDGNL